MVLSKDLKIAICFGLIIGVLCSLYTCFASETVDLSYASGVGILPTGNTGTIISTGGSGGIYYVQLEPGYIYSLTNDLSADLNCGFFNDIVEGSSVSVFSLGANETMTFSANDVKYLYVGRSTSGTVGISITREELSGLTGVVDKIAYALSLIDLALIFNNIVPILGISVLLGLGFYFVKRVINKTKKAKGGI